MKISKKAEASVSLNFLNMAGNLSLIYGYTMVNSNFNKSLCLLK
jgi:hypothetical protein